MRILSAVLPAVILAGCTPTTTNAPVNSTGTNVAPPATTEPDNTGVNERDQNNAAAKTPINQNENEKDIKITADIRKTILATDGMSVNARNTKIITADGKVTLRGPVESADEKAKIESIATDVAGQGNVTSELEVK